MRKLAILTLVLVTTAATSAQAQHYHRNHGYRAPVYQHHAAPHHRGNWALPLFGGAIVGGIIANEYYRPRRRTELVCERYRVVDQYGYGRLVEDCYQQ